MSKDSKIYTKTGDNGETSLLCGARVYKHHIRIEAYGTLDELNSYIGLIRDQDIDSHYKETLLEIQNRLFVAESLVACEKEEISLKLPKLCAKDITLLENEIDIINKTLPEIKSFILPGGNTIVSYCHIARCVCRRAERCITALAQKSFVSEEVQKYLNRLSDYLFVLARKIAMDNNSPEIVWKGKS
ncbi:MAG: cob(I)yrinic acid a,c-diamide adenosyltransferase [Bacteroidetes bacterium]|nr:cob(I)yrinic acid a,c-diamide adenosyltransferase [Bacteroidota bacterium]